MSDSCIMATCGWLINSSMELIVKHRTKIFVYVGVTLVSIFIIGASFWYKSQYLKEIEYISSSVDRSDNQSEGVSTTISRETDVSTIDIECPRIPPQFEGAVLANEAIKKIYKIRADQFDQDVKDSLSNTNLPQEFKGSGVSSYYDVSYDVVASSSRYISYLVKGELFFVGSAHPSHTIDTFIFDIKNKRLIKPEEMFTASSSYLVLLSDLTRKDFSIRNAGGNVEIVDTNDNNAEGYIVDVSRENEGFKPTQENFSRILPTNDGLIVYFNEYQIAPYFVGPGQSYVPYASLKKIIDKEGVLGEYIK